MTVGQIFTKIGTFIENRQIFMLLNCNCAKLANFEKFLRMHRGAVFSWTQCMIPNKYVLNNGLTAQFMDTVITYIRIVFITLSS